MPSLEVRFCDDGHPPLPKGNGRFYLNGICGVKFSRTRIEVSIRVFRFGKLPTLNSESFREQAIQHPTLHFGIIFS